MAAWKKSGSKHIYFLLAASILLTAITGYLIHRVDQRKLEQTEILIQNHHIIERATELFASIQDAESGQRGYLLTGNEAYLEPYHDAMLEINKKLQHIEQLTHNNPEAQRIIIDRLYPRMAAVKNELEMGVVLFQQAGLEAALQVVRTDVGKQTMDDIRQGIGNIVEIETALLNERTAALDRTRTLYYIVCFSGLFFILATSFAALITIRRKNIENAGLLNKLVDSNDELTEMHGKQVKLNDKLSRFMGIAAHDLRSPLNAITTLTSLLQNDNDRFDPEHQEYLNYMRDSAHQMSRLINDLLDVNQNEEKTSVMIEEVNAHSLLKALFFSYEAWAREKRISLEYQNELDQELVNTDKSVFTQVADNLISNAIKFSTYGKSVSIRLFSIPDGFGISISDEGPGITLADQRNLYKKYHTLTARPTGGEKSTGLGLSIVKERIEAIDGEIICESTPGKGTIFTAFFHNKKHEHVEAKDDSGNVDELIDVHSSTNNKAKRRKAIAV